ncbi:unnamed protein product [Cyprideis torosa]|uniref:Uncharacterized protein n=1 Tax=Cyprideis torosa TaxID=163714 RepID=A0A7R8ZHX8_9CRUS|nr:unnamed protein product [Cyprideis torosa]CAG0883515.1 unnamed protein product [Cyprideis torosa]
MLATELNQGISSLDNMLSGHMAPPAAAEEGVMFPSTEHLSLLDDLDFCVLATSVSVPSSREAGASPAPSYLSAASPCSPHQVPPSPADSGIGMGSFSSAAPSPAFYASPVHQPENLSPAVWVKQEPQSFAMSPAGHNPPVSPGHHFQELGNFSDGFIKQEPNSGHALLRTVLNDTGYLNKIESDRYNSLSAILMDEGNNSAGNAEQNNNLNMALESLQNQVDISWAIQSSWDHLAAEIGNACAELGISPDPSQWSHKDVQMWLEWTVEKYGLPAIPNSSIHFDFDGKTLISLDQTYFLEHAPGSGEELFASLDLWRTAQSHTAQSIPPEANPMHSKIIAEVKVEGGGGYVSTCSPSPSSWGAEQSPSPSGPFTPASVAPPTPASVQRMEEESDDEDESRRHRSPSSTVGGSSHIHLWQFLKELLMDPAQYHSSIRWLDRQAGIFKIEDSVKVARLWGKRKNRPAMNYDKLSRSIRQYYRKGIMKKTDRAQRLVYQFLHPYHL